MYDPNGRLVRELGRAGQGPGEFGRISRLTVGPGDTIHIFELNRHSVLAPGLAGFVSVDQLPVPPRYVAFLADGRMIVQNMVVNQQGIGEPMHLIGPRGEIEHSFGGMGPWRPTEIYQSLRAIAPASGNRVWAARNPEYRIELWDPNGTRPILTLVRDADWFRPWSESDLHDSLQTLQRPHLTSVSEGPDGLLWTIIARPDPAWKPPERRGEIPVRDLDTDAMFNTIIEVLDPESGRLIASAEHQKSVSNFMGASGMVYTKREDLEGNTLIDVWRMEVSTPATCESPKRCR
jgi:hypothetical protein